MNGIIFDLDGTLWDSSEQVSVAWNNAMLDYSNGRIKIDDRFMKSIMGKTMDEIAMILFKDYPDLDITLIYNKCMEYEQDYLLKHGAVLFPELENTLKILSEKYILSIVSNCQKGYIETFLKHYGFEKYFSDIECFGNTLKDKAHNISLVIERTGCEKSVYVGDTEWDYKSAVKAGIPFIHSKYGFGSVPEDVPFINNISELPEKIKEFI
ncbi:MAG: HAD family hydrolase [Oscillospiraceae bacterium]|nr:HAD family hydrolase [Oscillospiraceae bacterium]